MFVAVKRKGAWNKWWAVFVTIAAGEEEDRERERERKAGKGTRQWKGKGRRDRHDVIFWSKKVKNQQQKASQSILYFLNYLIKHVSSAHLSFIYKSSLN